MRKLDRLIEKLEMQALENQEIIVELVEDIDGENKTVFDVNVNLYSTCDDCLESLYLKSYYTLNGIKNYHKKLEKLGYTVKANY